MVKKKDFLEKIERKCFILNLQWRIKRLFGDRTYFSTTGNFGNSKVYIVTNNVDLKIEKENVEIIYDLFTFLENYKKNSDEDLYICGGKSIYEQTINYVDEIIVTIMNKIYEGDIFMDIKILDQFEIINTTDFTDFTVLHAKRKK